MSFHNYSIGGNLNLVKTNQSNTITYNTTGNDIPLIINNDPNADVDGCCKMTDNDAFCKYSGSFIKFERDANVKIANNAGANSTIALQQQNNTQVEIKNDETEIKSATVDLSNLPTTAQTGTKLWNNSGIVNMGAGGSGAGAVLEEIDDFAFGYSYTTKSGQTMTFQNVTTSQLVTTTETQWIGSELTYLPPSGTDFVVYKLSIPCYVGDDTTYMRGQWSLWIDNIEQIPTRSTFHGSDYRGDRIYFEFPIKIDTSLSADDPDKCVVNSWTSAKKLEIRGRSDANWSEFTLCLLYYWDGSGTGTQVIPPSVGISAIKRS